MNSTPVHRSRVPQWLRPLLCALPVIVLVLGGYQTPLEEGSPPLQVITSQQRKAKLAGRPSERRAVWMTNMGAALLHHSAHLDETFGELAALNFNTVYPSVWNRGYTLYPSAVAKATFGARIAPRLHQAPHDILQSFIREAHHQGLAVMPWFEYGLMAPSRSHLAQRHPDWLTRAANGKKFFDPHPQPHQASRRMPLPLRNFAFEFRGTNMVWLNPIHPKVQTFLTNLIVETVDRYKVDGIQLDDHFGMPVTLGYDAYTVNLYKQEHAGKLPPRNPYDSAWMRWRSRKLTLLMSKIAKAVRAKNPNCVISLSPSPARSAYREYLQDWPTWVKQGLIDEVVVQVYRDKTETLIANLNDRSLQQARSHVPVSIGLWTGPLGGAKPLAQIQQQVTAVRKLGFQGIAFFSWETTLGAFKSGSHQATQTAYQRMFPELKPAHPLTGNLAPQS